MEPSGLASISLQQRVPFDTVDKQLCQIHLTHNRPMSHQQRKGDVLRLSRNIGEKETDYLLDIIAPLHGLIFWSGRALL